MISAQQCRAARALLAWPQDRLASASGVSKKTIAEFERGAQLPYPNTNKQLQTTLEENGIVFIGENGGGGGVRSRFPSALVLSRRIHKVNRLIKLIIQFHGQEYTAQLASEIFDVIDRSDSSINEKLDAHEKLILQKIVQEIEAGRAPAEGPIILTDAHFT